MFVNVDLRRLAYERRIMAWEGWKDGRTALVERMGKAREGKERQIGWIFKCLSNKQHVHDVFFAFIHQSNQLTH